MSHIHGSPGPLVASLIASRPPLSLNLNIHVGLLEGSLTGRFLLYLFHLWKEKWRKKFPGTGSYFKGYPGEQRHKRVQKSAMGLERSTARLPSPLARACLWRRSAGAVHWTWSKSEAHPALVPDTHPHVQPALTSHEGLPTWEGQGRSPSWWLELQVLLKETGLPSVGAERSPQRPGVCWDAGSVLHGQRLPPSLVLSTFNVGKATVLIGVERKLKFTELRYFVQDHSVMLR